MVHLDFERVKNGYPSDVPNSVFLAKQKGGIASLHSDKVNASKLLLYLITMRYPTYKSKILRTAINNGAPPDVIEVFEKLHDEQFKNPKELMRWFGSLYQR